MKILDNLKYTSNNINIRYFSNINNGIKPFLIDELQEEHSKKKNTFDFRK